MAKLKKTFSVPGFDADSIYEKMIKDIDKWKTSNEAMLGKIEIQNDPSHNKLSFTSKWVSAHLFCEDNVITIEAELGLFAMPFKSKVEEGIAKWIQKSFQTKDNNPKKMS